MARLTHERASVSNDKSPPFLTVKEAGRFLEKRGISVTRQALHYFIARHRSQCQRIGGSAKKVGLWLVPKSLLRNYRPSAEHQLSGRGVKKNA